MKKNESIVKDYYNSLSKEYVLDTAYLDMSQQYSMFEKYLNAGDKVLEIGFGSGRDFVYFSKKYSVYGIDITENFVDALKSKGYSNVFLMSATDFDLNEIFDGIWACASLLHVEKDKLKKTFCNILNHLKRDGVFYFSFKKGNFDGIRNGRYFVDMDDELLNEVIKDLPAEIVEKAVTSDVRATRSDVWLNVVLRKTE